MVAYRLAHAARQPSDRPAKVWAIPVGVVYRLVIEWVMGCANSVDGAQIRRRLRVSHGVVLYLTPLSSSVTT